MAFRFAIFVLVQFTTFSFVAQLNQDITPDIRAYLFHVVRKSPILERNIGKAFEYKGPLVYLPDKTINYDSIEKILINNPQYLVIRTDEMAKCPKGVLVEVSNKTAIQEMCRQIQRYSKGEETSALPLLDQYFSIVFNTVPNEFLRGKYYEAFLDPIESPLLHTNFSLNDRIFEMQRLGITKPQDLKAILDAQHKAINQTIYDRTLKLFHVLGGESKHFESMLIAAGDGSYTGGMMEERDKDENGEWNKGLPKAIGLFPYTMEIVGTKKNELKSKRIIVSDFKTVGNDKQTQLHFDIWGYNSSNQTTVIIEKGPYQYPLFGSQTTRFLTPDSTFSKGNTFMKVLNDLNDITYKNLRMQIEGKGGYNDRINAAYKQLGEIETIINQKEGDLGELYKQDYKTKNKTNREMRKRKKAQDPTLVLKTTTKAQKKAKNKHQWDLVDLYGLFDDTNVELQDLIDERSLVAEDYTHRDKIYHYYESLLGKNWCPFTEKDGLYTFIDGATFDIYTQDFTFPPSSTEEFFQVKLLSIPEDFEGKSADEIMLHLSYVDVVPFYDADFELTFKDVFKSDDFQYKNELFVTKDTTFLKQIFAEFKKTPYAFELNLAGFGVGKWVDSVLIRDPAQSEQSSYPGENQEARQKARESAEYKSLRQSALYIKMNRTMQIQINSATDPVKSNLVSEEFDTEAFTTENEITKNELLSALRTRTILLQLKKELTKAAPKYLNTTEAKKFIDTLDLAFQKAKIKVGDKEVKLPKQKY